MDFAGFVSEELRKKRVDTILFGGACVSIYSENRYQSYDLDYVTYDDMKLVKQSLLALGFNEKNGYFQHEECKWFIEFVSPPVAVGNDAVQISQRLLAQLNYYILLIVLKTVCPVTTTGTINKVLDKP